VRIGVSRLGLLALQPAKEIKSVKLNTATAKLFKRELPEAHRILDTIRISQQSFSVKEASAELRLWY